MPKLLECLARQTLPQDQFQVLLVDNGSANLSIPERLPSNTSILSCKLPGSYAARNLGAAEAQGTYLAFTDADCRPGEAWLETFLDATSRATGHRCIWIGAVEMVGSSATPNAVEIFDIVRGIPQHRYVSRGYGATANLLVSKDTFEFAGRFDDTRLSGGDSEFCRRAGSKDVAIEYVDRAVVRHPARSNWKQISTKTRRVKGGQIASGSVGYRLFNVFRTLVPPLREVVRYASAREQPVRYRLTAIGLQFAVWTVELREMVRLLAGGHRERR